MAKLDDFKEVRLCAFDGREIPSHPGRGRHVYCSEDCAREARREKGRGYVQRFNEPIPVEFRNARRNWYRFQRRAGLSRREFMTGISSLLVGSKLEGWPTTSTARREEVAKSFATLRAALLRGERDFVIAGVPALRALLGDDRSAFAFRVETLCEELLRDVGVVGDWSTRNRESDRAFARVERRALAIQKRWAAAHDRLGRARALLTLASLYRQRKERQEDAMEVLRGVEYLLKWLAWDENPRGVNLLLHQTLSWKFRLQFLYPRELDVDKAEELFNRSRELAAASGSLIPQLITARDEAAFWQELHEPAKSEQVLQPARAQFSALGSKSVIAALSFRRAEVELSVLRSQQEAIEGIHAYRELWQKNPTAAQLKALRALESKCGLRPTALSTVPWVYSTPILAELWMDERLTAL